MVDYQLIETNKKGQLAYSSLLLPADMLSVFGSELSLKIIQELAKEPGCAMDIARKLEQHEQKIYYHLRRLENAGIVKKIRSEKRFGMIAKIYDVVCPVIATKFYEDARPIKGAVKTRDPRTEKFLYPFIDKGKLNAKIIIGSPHPHGKYEATALDAAYITDFVLFLGRFLSGVNNSYKLDTDTKEEDLKTNLILIGGPKVNTVVERVNSQLPIYFDKEKDWSIVSTFTKKVYTFDHSAIILRTKNPFNKEKEILLLAGKRSQGIRAAVLAFINNLNEIMKGNEKSKKSIAKVIHGIDKDSDGVIDSVKFLE